MTISADASMTNDIAAAQRPVEPSRELGLDQVPDHASTPPTSSGVT